MQDRAEKTQFLEIARQEDCLSVGLYGEEKAVSTVRYYNRHKVSFVELDIVCREISALVNKVNRSKDPDPVFLKGLKKSGQFLWEHLLPRSIKEKLAGQLNQNLVLLVDEGLVNLPWELLYDGDNFICLKYNLGRSIRTTQQVYSSGVRSFSDVMRMLILADPTGDLKSSYLEGVDIRDQFDAKRSNIHIDLKSSSVDRLFVKKAICDYDVVHFAGHCEYDFNKPDNTGWLLKDGRFTSHDITLLGQSAPLPSLVFSNACYSAKNELDLTRASFREKNYSLASAFLFSGVRHYIGSIRRLDDESSLSFAREFYHHLVIGRSVGESMRLARLKLCREYGLSNIAWASYVLYGDPNFILLKVRNKRVAFPEKKKMHLKPKIMAAIFVSMCIIALGSYIFVKTPTLKPTSYYFFLKGKASYLRGDNQAAIEVLKRASTSDPGYLAVYPVLAQAYRRVGNKQEAIQNYYRYALQSEKENSITDLSRAYASIGWFYHGEGQLKKALEFYEKALKLSRQISDKLGEAIALRKTAVLYIDKKDYAGAIELLTKSSEINRERQRIYEHRYNLACDYFDMGLLFSNKEDFEAAKHFYLKSLDIFEKTNLKAELSDCYFNIGEIYLFEKQYQKALDYYKKGLQTDLLHNNRLSLASDYNMLGELYVEMDRHEDAQSSFITSVNISKEIGAQPELAVAYRNLGLLYKKILDKPKALDFLRKAYEIYKANEDYDQEQFNRDISGLE